METGIYVRRVTESPVGSPMNREKRQERLEEAT